MTFKIFPSKNYLWMIIAQLVWVLLLLALGSWWSYFAFQQNKTIHTLKAQLGVSAESIEYTSQKIQTMLYSETLFFILILLCLSLFIFWLYWQEFKRSHRMNIFFASLTHELRTPLTSIRLQIEALKKTTALNIFLDRLSKETLRLELELENTLALAHLPAKRNLYNEKINLDEYLTEFFCDAKEFFYYPFESVTHLQETQLLANPQALKIIFRNLLKNSIDHSHEKPLKVHVYSYLEKKNVWVIFEDNGTQATIKSCTNFIPHRGIGLYLVAEFMKSMKGRMIINNKDGFKVHLQFNAAN